MVMTGKTPSVFMFNPLTRCRIELPPLNTLPHILEYRPFKTGREYVIEYLEKGKDDTNDPEEDMAYTKDSEEMESLGIAKAVFSGNPSLKENQNLVVMIIYSEYQDLGFCRSGDDRWTCLDEKLRCYDDMIYWKDAFYLITRHQQLFRCTFDVHEPVLEMLLDPGTLMPCSHHCYLVASEGELLAVRREYMRCDEEVYKDMVHCGGHCRDEEEYQTVGADNFDLDDVIYVKKGTALFRVYKADLEKQTWSRVRDLGNQVLFVGINSCMSFDVRDFPECKRNHIYFTNDENSVGGRLTAWEKDLGAMDLKTSKISPFPGCSELTSSTMAIAIWMKPSLH